MQIPYKFNPLGNENSGGELMPIVGTQGVFVYASSDVCHQSAMTVYSRFMQSANTDRMEVYSSGTAVSTTAADAAINVYNGGSVSQILLNHNATLNVSATGFAEDISCNKAGYITAHPGATIGKTFVNTSGILSAGSNVNFSNLWVAIGGSCACLDGDCHFTQLNLMQYAPISIAGTGNTFEDTMIWEYASVICSSGMNFTNTTVNYGGTMSVLGGALASGAHVHSGALFVYNSGAKAYNVDYDPGAQFSFFVYGSDSNTILTGSNESGAYSVANGVASNIILYPYNRFVASYYGTASDVYIDSSAVAVFSLGAFVDECRVMPGGSLSFFSGASGHYIVNSGVLWGTNGIAIDGIRNISPGTATFAHDCKISNLVLGSGRGLSVGARGTVVSGSLNGQLHCGNSFLIEGITVGSSGAINCPSERCILSNVSVESRVRGDYEINLLSKGSILNCSANGHIYCASSIYVNGLELGSRGTLYFSLGSMYANQLSNVVINGGSLYAPNAHIENLNANSGAHITILNSAEIVNATIGSGAFCGPIFGGKLTNVTVYGTLPASNSLYAENIECGSGGYISILLNENTLTSLTNYGTVSVNGSLNNLFVDVQNAGSLIFSGGQYAGTISNLSNHAGGYLDLAPNKTVNFVGVNYGTINVSNADVLIDYVPGTGCAEFYTSKNSVTATEPTNLLYAQTLGLKQCYNYTLAELNVNTSGGFYGSNIGGLFYTANIAPYGSFLVESAGGFYVRKLVLNENAYASVNVYSRCTFNYSDNVGEISSGAVFSFACSQNMLVMSSTHISSGASFVQSGGTVYDFDIQGGAHVEMIGHTMYGASQARPTISSGAYFAVLNSPNYIGGANIKEGAIVHIEGKQNQFYNFTNAGTVLVSGSAQYISGATVNNGGKIYLDNGTHQGILFSVLSGGSVEAHGRNILSYLRVSSGGKVSQDGTNFGGSSHIIYNEGSFFVSGESYVISAISVASGGHLSALGSGTIYVRKPTSGADVVTDSTVVVYGW